VLAASQVLQAESIEGGKGILSVSPFYSGVRQRGGREGSRLKGKGREKERALDMSR